MTVGAVVLDIEGTVSTLASVREVLFPYARERLADWVHRSSPDVQAILDEVRDLAGVPSAGPDELAGILIDWTDRDVKAPPLKSMQGLIWQEGFAAGQLTGLIYDDVPPALAAWRTCGVRLYVYSSGSVQAQRNWFRWSDHGDLSGYFTGYFDTRHPGPKLEPSSYRALAVSVGLEPRNILFVSDARAELDAARAAGLRTLGMRRVQDGSPDVGDHPAVTTFAELLAAQMGSSQPRS